MQAILAKDQLPAGRVTEQQAKELPVGTRVTFNRHAAQCYATIYWRVAEYEVTPRKRGKGNYLRLINSGYGVYPYFGGKYNRDAQGKIH